MTPDTRPTILCLSHLRWDHVWQRPQQLLSRLARDFQILYVAEPEIGRTPEGEPYLRLVAEDEALSAWQPVIPDRPEAIERWRETYMRLVMELLVRRGPVGPGGASIRSAGPLVAWFYTPTPWYLLDAVPADLVVYDVMDELANFAGAAADLRFRESRLLGRADLVFAGGRSLYAARRDRHPRVHLFPSGVDAPHFARAADPDLAIPAEVAALPRPILGYYGVIDERIDLDLLRDLALRCPDWSIAMVGPLAKVAPERLPRAPNIHYLGQQPYARLPAFLRAFDVCLMPFALNDATRSISPTKGPEYMAAGKPIVSTAVPDVVASWPEAVTIASGADGFVDAVQGALGEPDAQRESRLRAQGEIVANSGWDRVAGEMCRLIVDSLTAMTSRRP